MPLYTVASKIGLHEEVKVRIAEAITDIHCGLTGAPAEFVNVIFMTGYRLKRGKTLAVNGNVRTGGTRSDSILDNLYKTLLADIAAIAGIPTDKLLVLLIGVEPHWIMEGGMMLPAPGDEEEWLKAKNTRLNE